MAIIATMDSPMIGEMFVFDLEIVGPGMDNLKQNYIWDLAMLHVATRQLFQAKVDPELDTYPEPPHPDLFPVDKDYLCKANARPFAEVMPDLVAFVRGHCARPNHALVPALLMSHGTFVLDKPVLEREFARQNKVVPSHWYFYDTLPFFRRAFRKKPSYALKSLYQSVFWRPPQAMHFASADVMTLLHLLLYATQGNPRCLSGAYCPAYLTPLQTLKYVGWQKERLLVDHGNVTCVEDLVVYLAKNCGLTAVAIGPFLRDNCAFEQASAVKVANSIEETLLSDVRC